MDFFSISKGLIFPDKKTVVFFGKVGEDEG